MAEHLVEVRDLVKHFPLTQGIVLRRQVGAVHAVDGVSLDVVRGETLGIVGETGCGKSTTARLLLRLLDPTSGSISFDGEDITTAGGKRLKRLRREMQMIFQDPYSSLNPRQTVGTIIAEPFAIHGMKSGKGERKRAVRELMDQVGLNAEHYNRYPHEFSGGQRQRIGVARAIALRPKLIVADEPVSALDVSIQAQILNLLRALQRDLGLTMVFIAHDLSVVRHMCDRIAVMYLGRIVELASSDELYHHARHPYTGIGSTSPPDPVRRRAVADQPAARLPLPYALPARRQRSLRRRRAPAGAQGRWRTGGLSLPARGSRRVVGSRRGHRVSRARSAAHAGETGGARIRLQAAALLGDQDSRARDEALGVGHRISGVR
jgi:peptide/nickel transport system ATP-binding protein/oligopeptide transport system ATP-binding protein